MSRLKNHPIITVVLATLWLTQFAWGDLGVRFDAPSHTVGLGDVFTVDILADIDATTSVLGWGLDLSFDESILSLVEPPAIGTDWFSVFTPDGDVCA